MLSSTKLWQNVSNAVIGRVQPSQLAWGVAFGVLLGLVPHNNLLAIGLVFLILGLQLNHGLAAVTAFAATLISGRLDPISHQVGRWALTNDRWSTQLADLWQLPFVPWTDLNNTVVMGSLLLGTGALLPIFLLTYPLFHLFSSSVPPLPQPTVPASGAAETQRAVSSRESRTAATLSTVVFEPVVDDAARKTDDAAHKLRVLQPHAIDAAMGGIEPENKAKDFPHGTAASPFDSSPSASEAKNMAPQLIETRIDVVRLTHRKGERRQETVEAADISKQDQPMSEALQYLLRQARDLQDRRAA